MKKPDGYRNLTATEKTIKDFPTPKGYKKVPDQGILSENDEWFNTTNGLLVPIRQSNIGLMASKINLATHYYVRKITPKIRYFVHVSGFADRTAYIEVSSKRSFLIRKDGSRSDISLAWPLQECLNSVTRGSFKEITESEALKLATPTTIEPLNTLKLSKIIQELAKILDKKGNIEVSSISLKNGKVEVR